MGLISMLAIKGEFNTNNLPNTITDIDGNVYHTITIGTQIWMVENLKTTKYRNGDSINTVIDSVSWVNLTTGAYCNYNNDANNLTSYGSLYNWFTVTDSRNIAPIGWHVPTDAEWDTLIMYLIGYKYAGGQLKDTTHWNYPNTGATNESGFMALPCGHRGNNGKFGNLGNYGYWWTATEADQVTAMFYALKFNSTGVAALNTDKRFGYSIRCIKD